MSAGPLRLLILEDEPRDAELSLIALRRAGLDVAGEVVETVEALLDRLRTRDIDIVLSDFRMPGLSGLEAFTMVRQAGFDVPFILVTGTLGEETAVECLKQGITDYVLKDRLPRLPVAIQRAIGERAQRLERERGELRMLESERRFRELFERAPYGIYRATNSGTLTHVNPAFVRLLGCESDREVLGRNVATQVYRDPADRERLAARCRERGVVRDEEVGWKRKDGTPITVRLSGTALRDERGEVTDFEVFVEDVTERRALEEQLRHAQRIEAVGQLAGGVAHDFNNLLQLIGGYSEILCRNLRPDDPNLESATEIHRAADRAAAVTRQLLAFSRKQVMQPQVVEVNRLLAGLESLLRRLIREDIRLVLRADARPDRVLADPGQIEQVVMNLVLNARDAMPAGGTITLATAAVELGEEFARLHPGSSAGLFIKFSCSDTGEGMTAETLRRVFEPFFTTKEVGRGTGLGLSVVYGIVKQSGGYIRVESEPGRGAAFDIFLPRAEGAPVPARATAYEARPGHGAERILLVEDQEEVRQLLALLLETAGYRVTAAGDAAKAMEIAGQSEQTFDLLITDLIMPGANGRELVARIWETRPGLRVLFISGYAADTILQSGPMPAGTAFITKPISREGLLTRVREMLDGEGPAAS